MPVFTPHGPFVPDELVHDLEDDRVVLFCGAGISMDAGLPSYTGLVAQVFEAMGFPLPPKRDRAWHWPDRLLGELEVRSQPGEVRRAAAAILSRAPMKLDYHRALLRLARLNNVPGLRLVTTNFDTYFETADPALRFGADLHSGPVLPIPRDDRAASWRSVVHLHGRLESPAHGNDHLVLTSADFGRAYLTDGWAARFVTRLFAHFTVLFVGYSLNDPVLRYMTDAFAAEAAAARRRSSRATAYIFVPFNASNPAEPAAWRDRGLEPIFYHAGWSHRRLRETLVAWAAARDLATVCVAPSNLYAHVAVTTPAKLFEPLSEDAQARLHAGISFRIGCQHGDPAHSLGLLRATGERPRNRHTTDQRQDLPPPHEHLPRRRTCSRRQ